MKGLICPLGIEAKYGFETLDEIKSTSEIHYLQEESLRKERVRYLKDLTPSLQTDNNMFRTQIPYTKLNRKKVFLRLPDKSVVDKQAKLV